MGSGKKVTIGYEYYAGMHIVACHAGENDSIELRRIIVGERTAWSGSVTANTQIFINQPNLFGGKKREGGVRGAIDIEFGKAAQGQNDYLAAKVDANVPNHHGVFGMVLRQCMLSMINPYVKPWSPELKRLPGGGWYTAKRAIGDDANPAHIVYELLTNADWGLGYAAADIDEASFTAAADTLYTEGFGLSILWDQPSSINDFMQLILQHIDATVFVDPRTGLFRIKLLRNDYVASLLQGFDDSHVISVESFARPPAAEMFNTVTVNWVDRDGKRQATTVHDIAGISETGQQVAISYDMNGIADAVLALKVAMRELGQVSRPLAKATLIMTRAASGVAIGDVIKLTLSEYGLYQTAMRVAGIAYGTLADGRIRVDVVEDVFSLPAYAFTNVQEGLWTSPYTAPANAPYRVQMEAPWWTVVHEITGESATAQADLDPAGGFLLAGAGGVSGDTVNYSIWTRQGAADYEEQGTGEVTPTATLAAALSITATSISVENGSRLENVETDTWAVIAPGTAAEEIVKVKTIDVSGGLVGVGRGVLDTVPVAHAAGERIWFLEGDHFIGAAEYLDAETLNVKTTPSTSLGTLDVSLATQDSYTFDARMIRPYAPGKVQVNGTYYPGALTGDLAITWAHRDRTLQTVYLVEQTEASIGPEAGTTYTIRIYNAQTAGTLIRTYSGLTGTSQAYTEAQAATDNGGTKPANIRIEIESTRDGFVSWQHHTIAATWS